MNGILHLSLGFCLVSVKAVFFKSICLYPGHLGVRVGTIADLTECNVAAALMMIDVDNLCKSCGIGGIYGKLTVLGHKVRIASYSFGIRQAF